MQCGLGSVVGLCGRGRACWIGRLFGRLFAQERAGEKEPDGELVVSMKMISATGWRCTNQRRQSIETNQSKERMEALIEC